MPKSPPRTLQNLATHLGLSLATVSLVLNGRARELRISARTETRIRRAAERYAIAPNRLAASLRSGRTASVGLVVPDVANPFFAVLAQQLERALRRAGRAVLLADSEETLEVETRSLRELRQRRVDGLIVAPVDGRNPLLPQFAAEGLPLVCLDRVAPDLAVPQVTIDHAGAARLAVEALLQQGHRRIGCLRGTPGVFSDDERVRGYREALATAGIAAADAWIDGGDFTRATARAAAERLLDRGELTAIVPLAGQATLGLLELIRARGVRCPEQLSLVAFDEQPWSGLVSPPLTTIAQPVAEMAQAAANALHELLAGRDPGPPGRLPSRLIVRSSIARPRELVA
jgi:LacI family transcriptional regulator